MSTLSASTFSDNSNGRETSTWNGGVPAVVAIGVTTSSMRNQSQSGSSEPLSLRTGESLLWEGGPSYGRKRALVAIISGILLIIITRLPTLHGPIVPLTLSPVVFVALGSLPFAKFAGVHYHVTSQRVVRMRSLSIYKKNEEMPLNLVVAVRTARRRGRGFVSFSRSNGIPIVFSNLGVDPDLVKQIVVNAQQRMRESDKGP